MDDVRQSSISFTLLTPLRMELSLRYLLFLHLSGGNTLSSHFVLPLFEGMIMPEKKSYIMTSNYLETENLACSSYGGARTMEVPTNTCMDMCKSCESHHKLIQRKNCFYELRPLDMLWLKRGHISLTVDESRLFICIPIAIDFCYEQWLCWMTRFPENDNFPEAENLSCQTKKISVERGRTMKSSSGPSLRATQHGPRWSQKESGASASLSQSD
jgi:hypothetical protein